MIRAVAIDDESNSLELLKTLIETYIPEISELQLCASPVQARDLLAAYKPDLVFLDIEMPGASGFDLLNALPEINFDIIFTTAYNQYAIQAIKHSALDYLLKPIDVDELEGAVQRHLRRAATNQSYEDLVKNLLNNLDPDQKSRITLTTSEGTHFLVPDEIIRLQADRNYTEFHLNSGKKIVSARTLKEFEILMEDYNFIRSHKSHLINPSHVRMYDHEGYLVLSDGTRVIVSRRRKEAVLKTLGR